MEPYSERELIDFVNYCIAIRTGIRLDHRSISPNIINGITDAELQNWKETLKQERREQKINEILK